MKLSSDGKAVEIVESVTKRIDLVELDTKIAHLRDVIGQAQKELDLLTGLKASIEVEFPALKAEVIEAVHGV
jgi:hypothetical protein